MMETTSQAMAVMLIAWSKLGSTARTVTQLAPIPVSRNAVMLLTTDILTATMATLLMVMAAHLAAKLKLDMTATVAHLLMLMAAMKSVVTA
jgi:hypothetical protein